MSVLDVLRKDLGNKKKGAVASDADSPPTASTPSRGKQGAAPIMAISPRANLLPPEIGQNQRKRSVRRGLRFAVVGTAIVAVAASGGAFYLATAEQIALTSAQTESTALSSDLAEYADVDLTVDGIVLRTAGIRVAGSTDILWADYLTKLQATLPSDVVLTAVSISSAGAVDPYEQSTAPLDKPRVASLTFTAETGTLPSIPSWIDGLATLPGFTDATPDSLENADGIYTATVTMNIDAGAFSNRFAPKAEEATK